MPMPAPKPARKSPLRLPSGKRGRRILLGAGAAAVVVAVVAGAVIAISGGSGQYSGGTDTASAAVTAYLEALQRGDAETALSLGREQPPDTSMLTDATLKKQMEKFPITDVRILGDIPTADGGALVRLTAKFGGVDSDGSIKLDPPPKGEGWKLKTAAMAVEFKLEDTNPALSKDITVWGQPVPKSRKAYLFPGFVEFGSSNPSIEVANSPAVGQTDPSLYEITYMSDTIYPDFKVSDEGRKLVKEALKKALDDCASSTSLEPPQCPNKAARSDFVPDSAKWTAPPDVDNFAIDFMDEKTGQVTIIGNAEFGVSVRTTSGTTESGTFLTTIYGNADMTKVPPVIDLNKP
jgi:hypothetical protein